MVSPWTAIWAGTKSKRPKEGKILQSLRSVLKWVRMCGEPSHASLRDREPAQLYFKCVSRSKGSAAMEEGRRGCHCSGSLFPSFLLCAFACVPFQSMTMDDALPSDFLPWPPKLNSLCILRSCCEHLFDNFLCKPMHPKAAQTEPFPIAFVVVADNFFLKNLSFL